MIYAFLVTNYLYGLDSERERLAKNQEEFESIRQSNVEIEEEMRRCQAKEVELLGFTQKLTETNVQLQSNLTEALEKVCKHF